MNDTVKTSEGVEFLVDDFVTDPQLETAGVWRQIGKDPQGRKREMKLARIGTDEFNSFMRKKQRASQALLEQNDDEAFKLAEEITRETYAHTVIKGLRVNGEDVAYTAELGIRLLMNKDFHAKVKSLAEQADPYKRQDAATVKS